MVAASAEGTAVANVEWTWKQVRHHGALAPAAVVAAASSFFEVEASSRDIDSPMRTPPYRGQKIFCLADR